MVAFQCDDCGEQVESDVAFGTMDISCPVCGGIARKVLQGRVTQRRSKDADN